MSNTVTNENVFSAEATATGTLVTAAQGRLRGVWVEAGASAGTLIFKDGGAGGTIILTLDTPAGVNMAYMAIPGGGIAYGTDLHVTVSNAAGVTVIYATDNTL